MLFLDPLDVLDRCQIDWISAKRSVEPGIEDFFGYHFGRGAQADAQDIRTVPHARAFGRFCILAQGCADSGHFVRRDRDARARPTKDDSLVHLARCDALGNLFRDVRLVNGVAVERTNEFYRVATLGQILDNRVRQVRFFI